MGEVKLLMEKAAETLKTEGVPMLFRRTTGYIARICREKERTAMNKPERTFADVLFINGCYLPHPTRYRVAHQREQLWAGDVSSNETFYTELTMDMVRMYRVFIFFRCPYTELIGEFIKKAKDNHKVVLFDIDDLMIDKSYTKTIKHLDSMSAEELNSYYKGIELNQQTLKLCDGAITTTERMAVELKKYVSQVYINRNVASEEMLQLSENAIKKKVERRNENIRIGYFSGSITHNADVQLVLPVLVRIMRKYSNLTLVLTGDLDLPIELKEFQDRIDYAPFQDWKKLPELLASVDINIAPLEQSVFNEAKSENKWVEAALVKVPTVASKVGAFEKMIENGKTGVLCSNENEWEKALSQLIEDKKYRETIGNEAYMYCKENCTSVYTASKFASYIKKIMNPNIVFILPVLQISGGALVILKHCEIAKSAGYDVTLINQGNEADKYVEKDGSIINVVSLRDVAISATIDKAVATLWTTIRFFEQYAKIKERYYNVQNFETDFYEAGNGQKIEANRTYCSMLPIKYVTISKWCEEWLQKKYCKMAQYAPNGLYVDRFYPVKRDWSKRKIRILVEGNSNDYYKNVDESFRIVDLLDKEKYEIWFMSYQGKPKAGYYVDEFLHKVPYEKVPDIYRKCDILIKSSILESFSYPPLEMMATGGYVVVAPNGGNLEYLRDDENCLFYDHDNLQTAVSAIEKIVKNAELREKLYENGICTAQSRDWDIIKKDVMRLYDISI